MRRFVADGWMDGRNLACFAHSLSSKGIIRSGLERNDLILRGCPMLETSAYVSATTLSFFAITPSRGWIVSTMGILWYFERNKRLNRRKKKKDGERRKRRDFWAKVKKKQRIKRRKKDKRKEEQKNKLFNQIYDSLSWYTWTNQWDIWFSQYHRKIC